jgi:hypothetical protein
MRNQSLLSNLRKLQVSQFRHDQVAHQDIAGLPVPRRVTHFTLHFSKYVGALARALREGDDRETRRVITDSFIIALASANAMNVDLKRRIEEGTLTADIATLNLDHTKDANTVLMRYAEVVGEMCKASEALDHMEDFPSRKVQERGVVLVLVIVRRLADLMGMDLSALAKERWTAIEQKPMAGKERKSDHDSTVPRVA